MRLLLFAGLGAVLTIPFAPQARADSYNYINNLDSHGIYYSSESAALDVGRSICNALDSGVSVNKVITAAVAGSKGAYTQYEVKVMIADSVTQLCPEESAMLGGRNGTTVA